MNLKVEIDQNSGFCFGVIYAIEMAEEILNEQHYLYCLGDIVHNDEEVKRLVKKGLIIIQHNDLVNLKNEKILIRAHGEPPSTYRTALDNNLQLIDASCPVVLKLQNRIRKSYERNDNIFIYGKHGHAEVLGLKGQTNDSAMVFQDIREINIEKLPKKITLFSQTTKSIDKFYQISNLLKESGVEVETNDTICRQVSNRDTDLRNFAGNYDKIIFVSGTKSSNGKNLFDVCKSTNPKSYFVSNISDINKKWFTDNDTIGICGATSTPMWLMEDIKQAIESLSSN